MKDMNILFTAQNFNTGGVQQSLVNTCNELSEHFPKWNIDVFTFSGGELENKLSNRIHIRRGKRLLNLLLTPLDEVKKKGTLIDFAIRSAMVVFAKIFGTETLYRLLFQFEKTNVKYDIAVSFFNDVSGGVSNRGTDWFVGDYVDADNKIAWVHTDPEKAKFDRKSCLKKYRNFNKIVCVSKAVKTKLSRLLPEYSDKMAVVYNVFQKDDIINKSKLYVPFENEKYFNIVSVGRVDNVSKRMDRIVEICEILKKKGVNNFYWRVVGDGPDMELNKKAAHDLGVEDVLEFVGNKNNPYPYIANSDLLVLTSDYEGYPMVICESMILGVPVVSTDFAAAEEMIQENQGCITSMSSEKIANVIYELITDKNKYRYISDGVKSNNVNQNWKSQIESVLYN